MQTMKLWMYAALIPAGLALVDTQHFLGPEEGRAVKPASPKEFKEITANDNTCFILWFVALAGAVFQWYGQSSGNETMERGGGLVTLVMSPCIVVYAWHHGLMEGYWKGTIDPIGHNFCNSVGLMAIMTFAVSAILCVCCVPTIAILVHMNHDSEQMILLMDAHEQEKLKKVLEEACFQVKCSEAFKLADADGNGKLDLTELQHVSLGIFDIPDRLKDVVKEHDLFKKAFVENDKNKDKFIDGDEFVDLMKWIVVKAKSEASEAESEQITQSISKKVVA